MFCYGRCGVTVKHSNHQATPSSPPPSPIHPAPTPALATQTHSSCVIRMLSSENYRKP